MNTISDEIVYKLHALHCALNQAQKIVSILEKENSCLKQKLLDLSLDNDSIKECLEPHPISETLL